LDLFSILNPVCLNKIKKLDWKLLWINKSNYIEKYYYSIRENHEEIDESINYYMGMVELAIQYLKEYDSYDSKVYLQHVLILDDNSLHVKEDIAERDLAEYFKYLFVFKKYKDIGEIYEIIESMGNIQANYDLIVARLLFPSYYFFFFEKMIDGEDSMLLEIIERSREYERYVNLIVKKINEYYNKKMVLPF